MNQEMHDLRDALIDRLHGLADDQDQHARWAIRERDLQKETAHRAAAIGLRMAAGVVSANLSPDPVAQSLSSLPGEPGALVPSTLVSWRLVAAGGTEALPDATLASQRGRRNLEMTRSAPR